MLDTYGFYMGNAQILVGCRFFLATVKGTARDTWLGVIDDNLAPPGRRDAEVLQRHLASFWAQILDKMAVEEQINYLRTTKKPKSMPVKDWIRRMKTINNHLPFMGDDVERLSEAMVIQNCITPNIPFP